MQPATVAMPESAQPVEPTDADIGAVAGGVQPFFPGEPGLKTAFFTLLGITSEGEQGRLRAVAVIFERIDD